MPASERLHLGFIGLGAMGRVHFNRLAEHPGVRPIAVADPDALRRADAVCFAGARKHAVSAYTDFRDMLAEHPELDAVFVSTPDHWHAPVTLACLKSGIDVYCETPLSRTIAEGRAVADTAQRLGRIVQTGASWRSGSAYFRQACAWVRGGRIGELQKAVCFFGANPWAARVPEEAPPEHLDWNLYLGVTPWRPYHRLIHPYNFRYFRDFSGGSLSDWGIHLLDVALCGMDKEHTGPKRIEAQSVPWENNTYEFPRRAHIRYDYGGMILECIQGDAQHVCGSLDPVVPFGVKFHGSEGSLFVNGSGFILRNRHRRILSLEADVTDGMPGGLTAHHERFFKAVRAQRSVECDVEAGHRSASAAHLGNLAIALGRPLDYDPVRECFPFDPEAQACLGTVPSGSRRV